MAWIQKELVLRPYSRGFHLITGEVVAQVPGISHFEIGIANLFIQHTSASICLSECVEPEVRTDMESHFNRMVPENRGYYLHTYEGPDDMPAHIKSVLLGASLTIPIFRGKLNLGMWQGIYLCEHRDRAGSRRLVITMHGDNSVPKLEEQSYGKM